MKVCAACGTAFASRMLIDGKPRVLSSRRFCTACSPFGAHNSSRRPLVNARARRLESWVSYSQRFLGSIERARREADKCSLLCANCHRRRHLVEEEPDDDPVVRSRRLTKRRAVALLGGHCAGCAAVVPEPLFEFHHVDARVKDFAISHDGIPRRWSTIEAELAKCVLLCANCHRETHAGVRSFTDDPAIGEGAGGYGLENGRPAA